MTLDQRLEALTMNMELAWREIEEQRRTAGQILAAADKILGITETHERRFSDLLRVAESHERGINRLKEQG